MKSSSLPRSLRQAALLGLAAAALLCAGGASAQTAPFTFQVTNLTNVTNGGMFQGGSPDFPVTDDLTFTNLLVTETFSGGSTLTLPLADLDTGTIAEETSSFTFDGSRGSLLSAILTGRLDNGLLPGGTQTLNLQPVPNGPVSTQLVATSFSASLLGPATSGVGVGQFTLLFNGNPFLAPVTINASPVPEASTVVSMGLMLALGLGALVAARRRRTALAE